MDMRGPPHDMEDFSLYLALLPLLYQTQQIPHFVHL